NGRRPDGSGARGEGSAPTGGPARRQRASASRFISSSNLIIYLTMKKLLTMFAIVCAFLASCDSEGGDLNRTPLLKVVGPDGSDPSQPISIDGKSQEVAFTVLATADWTADIAGDE